MTDYPNAFRALVMPQLRAAIDSLIPDIVNDVIDHTDAHHEIMRLAQSRGANFLGHDHWVALMDWVDTQILTGTMAEEVRRDTAALQTILANEHRLSDRQKRDLANLFPGYRQYINREVLDLAA